MWHHQYLHVEAALFLHAITLARQANQLCLSVCLAGCLSGCLSHFAKLFATFCVRYSWWAAYLGHGHRRFFNDDPAVCIALHCNCDCICSAVQAPFTYEALPPEKINFIPLKQKKSFNGRELMQVCHLSQVMAERFGAILCSRG